MGRRISPVTIAILVIAAIVLPQLIVEACGPDLSPPTFTHESLPGVPLKLYAQGKLELLQPGFRRVYLFVAYRNLIGKPLGGAEVAAVKRILSLSNYWNVPEQPGTRKQAAQVPVNWIDRWKAAREKVPGPKAKIDFGYPDRKGIYKYLEANNYYLGYLNCASGAFQHAVTILNRRISRFGAESPYVKQWLAAQDEVFANCTAGFGYPPRPPVATIPAPAPATDPKLIRQDRAYQIAAAHFYAGDLAKAKTEFAAIGKDPSSPYRKIAPYLVARCLVREGTLTPADDKINAPPLEQAERRLESILSDAQLDEYHHSARGLLQFVRIRLYPQRRERKLALALGGTKPDPEFHQNLVDYLWLFDHSISREKPKTPSGAAASPDSPAAAPPGGMTDWILTFSKPGATAFPHALALWRQTRRLPWLVAAISKAQGSDPASTQLVAAAAKVPVDSPAYVTVTFHRLRLLAETGHTAEARRGLDRELANTRVGLTQSTRNEFLALRMSLSRSLAEWLRYAARRPVDMGGYEYATPAKMAKAGVQMDFFDRDAALTLTEKLPLSMLAKASRSTQLPAGLRREIATATWTRAILLGNAAVARREARVLAALAPELRDSLAAYQAAKSGSQRKFAAVFLLLRFPGMRPFVPVGVPRWSLFKGPQSPAHIDMFRNNWWCAMASQASGSSWQFNYQTMNRSLTRPLRLIYLNGTIPSPGFLTVDERAAARKEWSALEQLPSAPNWLARGTLAWAKAHPRDPRVPEALHLVVRATRYGCNDANTGSYSKRAFLLLHQRYPRSPWTRKTPYWFN
jgi:hypothetical protein